MARRPIEVLPFARDLRSARRGAAIGAAVGIVVFLATLLRYGGSARQLLGGLLMSIGGGAMLGALLPLGPATRYAGARPESKLRLIALLLCIAVLGMGAVVLGVIIAGIAGDRPAS